jgi:hypothetical protein
MSETVQIIIGVALLIGVYLLTQVVVGWRIRRAARAVMRDLEHKKALGPDSAIELPYAKSNFFKIGLKDFRPKAVEALRQGGMISQTAAGRFYVIKRMQKKI